MQSCVLLVQCLQSLCGLLVQVCTVFEETCSKSVNTCVHVFMCTCLSGNHLAGLARDLSADLFQNDRSDYDAVMIISI